MATQKTKTQKAVNKLEANVTKARKTTAITSQVRVEIPEGKLVASVAADEALHQLRELARHKKTIEDAIKRNQEIVKQEMGNEIEIYDLDGNLAATWKYSNAYRVNEIVLQAKYPAVYNEVIAVETTLLKKKHLEIYEELLIIEQGVRKFDVK